ncbi:MAG: preprotein translocase subunit SecA, partial [Clostridiales bacterium]|nr:preprotein translocase subunit SecA [Clostridiales bacterium]
QSRKTVLEYDDVMNLQREIIYKQRRQVLDGEDLKGSIEVMIRSVIAAAVDGHMGEQSRMDAASFKAATAPFRGVFLRADELLLSDEALAQRSAQALRDELESIAFSRYAAREQTLGTPLMRELERVITLRTVDEYWMDHIDAMQELRQGISLRAYGQSNPVVEYKREGFEMFEAMVAAIQEETVRRVFTARVQSNTVERQRVAKVTGESAGGDGTVKRQPVKKAEKIGRNDPCPCGSGLKWKKCTCAEYHNDM